MAKKVFLPPSMTVIRPDGSAENVISEILNCECLISGSLRGLIVAEAFGIPCRWFSGDSGEPEFKYFDYYGLTGRAPERAISLSDEESIGAQPNPLRFNTNPLLQRSRRICVLKDVRSAIRRI